MRYGATPKPAPVATVKPAAPAPVKPAPATATASDLLAQLRHRLALA